jgi:uncharacterized protein YcbK (DUF882 family)
VTSRWFHIAEMACHDGTPYPAGWVDERLAPLFATLDVIRGAWGGPLRVVSGYRTPAWNARVGGAGASQHMEGRAVDVAPLCAAHVMAEQCRDLHARVLRLITTGALPLAGGLGLYPGWIHVDVRRKPPGGHVAQWSGEGVGSEVT